jgi:hypothetical protein
MVLRPRAHIQYMESYNLCGIIYGIISGIWNQVPLMICMYIISRSNFELVIAKSTPFYNLLSMLEGGLL